MKILLTMMALLLAGPVAAPAQMESTQVEIRGHGFSAPALTVKAGTTVTWINHDDDAHTVTSTANTFRSPSSIWAAMGGSHCCRSVLPITSARGTPNTRSNVRFT